MPNDKMVVADEHCTDHDGYATQRRASVHAMMSARASAGSGPDNEFGVETTRAFVATFAEYTIEPLQCLCLYQPNAANSGVPLLWLLGIHNGK